MARDLSLNLRSQLLQQDASGRNCWRERLDSALWPIDKTCLLLCDVWDNHWSKGAAERLCAMVPRMNAVVNVLRERGVQVIHAPSGTMEFYAGTPARQRILDAPHVQAPVDLARGDPPLPVNDSDRGSDTPSLDRGHFDSDKKPGRAWTRQHPGIDIDQDRDGICDDGALIYNLMQQVGIESMLIMGVHTNMCVLNRTFAIKQMVRWGKRVVLIRDLTDAMYNPAKPPYVNHAEGTRLIIEYIEKFWCPTVSSADILNNDRMLGG